MHIVPLLEGPMGPRFVGFATVFYAALFGLAVALGALGGRDALALGDPVFFNLAAGVVTACGTVASGLLLYRLSPAIRRISDELAPRLVDGAKRRDLVLLSVMSGVGEEAFFRGALQPYLGIALTSILFGALHIGPDRRYLTWTFWAVGAGFLFGFLYEWTGGILAPTIAHVLHNAATLLLWKRSRRKISSLSIVPMMSPRSGTDLAESRETPIRGNLARFSGNGPLMAVRLEDPKFRAKREREPSGSPRQHSSAALSPRVRSPSLMLSRMSKESRDPLLPGAKRSGVTP